MTEKFLGYFRLLDACERTGCPVCTCLDEEGRRAVATLLSEHVTDLHTRRRLRASWGLCNGHTWMLLDAGTVATGAAILYEDLLRVCRARVDTLRGPGSVSSRLRRWLRLGDARRRRRPEGFVHAYRARARCPVCAALCVTEARYVAAVVEWADDARFAEAYGRSTGLCLPHLVLAAETAPAAPTLPAILDTTLAKWDDLRGDLGRFVAKNEYRSTAPISEREADSYRRAFDVLAGRRHLFGTDLHPRGSGGLRAAGGPDTTRES